MVMLARALTTLNTQMMQAQDCRHTSEMGESKDAEPPEEITNKEEEKPKERTGWSVHHR